MCTCVVVYALVRAEPVLARIKEDHKRIILPSIDNIKHDTFEVERYENSGHGYNWELWCMYINPPKQWWDEGDTSAPIRQASFIYMNTHLDGTIHKQQNATVYICIVYLFAKRDR